MAVVALVGALLPVAPALSDARDTGRSRRGPDDLKLALGDGLDRAEYSLERAASLFDLREARSRFGEVDRPDPHEATFLLRELAARVDDLEGRDKERAQRILARPTHGAADPQDQGYDPSSDVDSECETETKTATGKSMDLCFYWVSESGDSDAPNLTDADANSIPDYVDRVMTAYEQVWDTEINTLGYRMPLKDSPESDGGRSLDVYLADIGNEGLYGYCTNDNPRPGRRQSAYCVIDDDFSANEFAPGTSGLAAMKVTGAHEFFHAVQFAYDWDERLFFMEGTAVWVEDEVFDAINANYDYLHDSALHQPEVSLDAGDFREDENFEYGSWLFWRFLSERDDDDIIKEIWEGAAGPAELFPSLRSALQARGTTLPNTMGDFSMWNRAINANNSGLLKYEEGTAYMTAVNFHYPPWDARHWLGPSPSTPSTGWRELSLDHLSMRYVLMEPAPPTPGLQLQVKVRVPQSVGSQARLLLIGQQYDTGPDADEFCSKLLRVPVDQAGKGSRTVPFDDISNCRGETGALYFVFLTLVNGGLTNNATFNYKGAIQA